jgi:hypothetical protein
MGNLNPEVNKAEENFELNRPIFIQGLLGSIQGNRISVEKGIKMPLGEKNDTKKGHSCFLKLFYQE